MIFRVESDSIGYKRIDSDVYYGIQTLRAKENFSITNKRLLKEMIVSLAQIKQASALANLDANTLDAKKAEAIIKACDLIINGKFHDQFIVDPIQGGAGTSTNMNANEVIANVAIEVLNGDLGDYQIIHPNDDVNMAQSTNDVYPTAGKLTVLKLMPKLVSELERLIDALEVKAGEFNHVFKMGRTQLQDAVPMRLGQSFGAYSKVIKRDVERIKTATEAMRIINLGGTAIGTAINVDPVYLANIALMLSYVTKENLRQADDLIDATQNLDGFVGVSGALKNCAINLSKMSNDLRLLSSGPKTGLGEIYLPPKQNGSSIMPGKVNPVIPEVISQIAFNIIGNDMTITMASESGQMELNAFEPVLFDNLFESITTLTAGVTTLIDNCISGISANEERCQQLLDASVGTVTALCPYIGYKKAAELAKESLVKGINIKDLLVDHPILNRNEINVVMNVEKMIDPIHLQSKY